MLRQPIITILAHVDHGKTSLLDAIRKSAVAKKEAGGITQSISSTLIPRETIEKISGAILEKFKFRADLPGLLFIDTPGHAAFSTLRKRGGSIADLAILIVDINEGLMPQTLESIEILKETKTPFVVSVNKIDRVAGWQPGKLFIENYPNQSEHAKELFDSAFYNIIAQISMHGFSADRYDRVNDFKSTVAVVPISAKTGEGISELLAVLIGLSQQFLHDKLMTTENSEGMVLEVKDVTGLGVTVDTIVYDGTVSKNDFLIIGGKSFIVTKIKALLVPKPLKDIRTEKKFDNIEECRAACGVKISAPGLEDVVAGSVFKTAKTYEEAEAILDEMEREKEEIEVSRESEGLILKASTIGGLEALVNVFREHPIREAHIGNITKEDVIRAASNPKLLRVIVCFEVKPSEDISRVAKQNKITILSSDVIYRLIEAYEKFKQEGTEILWKEGIEAVTRAGKIKIIPGCIFRASNPAIVGCEVVAGVIKPGYKIFKDNEAGEINQIQSEGENIELAKKGDRVALSIKGIIIGRHVRENDELYTDVKSHEYKTLKENEKLLSHDEREVLEEIKNIKRMVDPTYGL